MMSNGVLSTQSDVDEELTFVNAKTVSKKETRSMEMSTFELEMSFHLDNEITKYISKKQSRMLLLAELVGLYFLLNVISQMLLYSYSKAYFLKSVLEDAFRVDEYITAKQVRQKLSRKTAGKSTENFGSPGRSSDLRSNRSRAS